LSRINQGNFMSKRFFYTFSNLLVVCIYILVLSTDLAQAQSGRRGQAPPPPAQPVIEPSTPKQTAKPPEADSPAPIPEKEPEVLARLLVTVDDNKFDNLGNLANVVVSTCSERLRQASALSVAKEKPLNRKEASDKAKAEEQHHVVWLHLQVDQFNNSRNVNLQDFQVEYIVFSPKDGKIKTQGKVYLRPYQPKVGIGGIGVPLPIPVPNSPVGVPGQSSPLQHSLEQAGVETADRIMQAFKVSPSPVINRRP
jgi:hypothetical protein